MKDVKVEGHVKFHRAATTIVLETCWKTGGFQIKNGDKNFETRSSVQIHVFESVEHVSLHVAACRCVLLDVDTAMTPRTPLYLFAL